MMLSNLPKIDEDDGLHVALGCLGFLADIEAEVH
jgi:hypothetical protein